jgi:hypothetical protein
VVEKKRRNQASEIGQRLRVNFSKKKLKPAARASVPFIGGRIELGHNQIEP